MNHYTFCKLLYVLYTPFQMLKMKLQGVKTEGIVYTCGTLDVVRFRGSTICIGRHSRFMSKRWGNRIGLNHGCMLTADENAVLTIGADCGFSGVSIVCCSEITIGNNVRVGANTLIIDGDGHYDDPRVSAAKPIHIGDNVFIGANCVIKKGVTIGENSVIGMNSDVTESIPANCVAAGFPAKPKAMLGVKQNERDSIKTNQDVIVDDEITTRVVQLISKKYPQIPLVEPHLVDNHILDSMTQISLVSHLSESFGIEIPYQEITAENFNSVEAMARMLARLRQNKSVVEQILMHSKDNPAVLAFVIGGEDITYGQFGNMIITYAESLKSFGVKRGENVILQAKYHVDYFAMLYAIQLLGAVAVPVERTIGEERIKEIINETCPDLIIAEGWTEYETVKTWVAVSETIATETYIKALSPSDSCLILYTTGTTGKSKGIVISHAALSCTARTRNQILKNHDHIVQILTFALNHASAINEISFALTFGYTSVVMDGLRNIPQFFELARRYKVNYINMSPSTLGFLLQVGKEGISSIKDNIAYISCISEPLPPTVRDACLKLFDQSKLYNCYGSTEMGFICASQCDAQTAEVPLGFPVPGVQIALRDEEGTIHTDYDRTGQLCVKSAMVMVGYLNQPELTASMCQDAWFVMGDLVYRGKTGLLFFRGRADDVIIMGGYKISPLEVENEAMNSCLVSECICYGRKDATRTVILTMAVVPTDDRTFQQDALLAYLSSHLEAYRVPKIIEVVSKLHRTYNGKLDRKQYC